MADLTLYSVKGSQLTTAEIDNNFLNSGQGFRNRIINGNFSVNQRAVSGTVTLAAGSYGHDRWKAGTGGCTYTFAASGNDTVITISAGSLMQVIEDKNIEGGVYAISHAGTAQARVAVNGAATSGAYATASQATPLASASATGGQAVTVEFSTGTISKVQCEPGSVATPFERRPYEVELARCQRYYEQLLFELIGYVGGINNFGARAYFKTTKRIAPSIAQIANASSFAIVNTGSTSNYSVSVDSVTVYRASTAAGTIQFSETLSASCEL